MSQYIRISDGADVDVEQWDGTLESGLEIVELTGGSDHRITNGTLMFSCPIRGFFSLRLGSWIVKSKSGWIVVPAERFYVEYAASKSAYSRYSQQQSQGTPQQAQA